MSIFRLLVHKLLLVFGSISIVASSLTMHGVPQSNLKISNNLSAPSITPQKTRIYKTVAGSLPKEINSKHDLKLSSLAKFTPTPTPTYHFTPTPTPTSIPTPTPVPTSTPIPIPTLTSTQTPTYIPIDNTTPNVDVLILGTNRCPENSLQFIEPTNDFMMTYKMTEGNRMHIKVTSGSLELVNKTLTENSGVLATLPHNERYVITLVSEKCDTHLDNPDYPSWFKLYIRNINY